jgi:hypothetical protein
MEVTNGFREEWGTDIVAVDGVHACNRIYHTLSPYEGQRRVAMACERESHQVKLIPKVSSYHCRPKSTATLHQPLTTIWKVPTPTSRPEVSFTSDFFLVFAKRIMRILSHFCSCLK